MDRVLDDERAMIDNVRTQQRIQMRRGTTQQWTQVNPVLAAAELGVEFTPLEIMDDPGVRLKIGNGVTNWNNLPHMGMRGPRGEQGEPGIPGPQGPQGEPGTSIAVKGTVTDVSELPVDGNEPGDTFIVQPDPPNPGSLYVWDGTQWVDTGSLQGPPGQDGDDGADGDEGPPGPQGPPGLNFTPTLVVDGELWIGTLQPWEYLVSIAQAPTSWTSPIQLPEYTLPLEPGTMVGVRTTPQDPVKTIVTTDGSFIWRTGTTDTSITLQPNTNVILMWTGQGWLVVVDSVSAEQIGTIKMWPGPTIPPTWMLCVGTQLTRTQYPDLFEALGGLSSPWGLPDANTFNIPDLQNQMIIGPSSTRAVGQKGGAEDVTLTVAQMPSHNHGGATGTGTSGAMSANASHAHTYGVQFQLWVMPGAGANAVWGQQFNASNGTITSASPATSTVSLAHTHSVPALAITAQGGGASHTNMPPWCAVGLIIKATL